jgi:hypothetical protein
MAASIWDWSLVAGNNNVGHPTIADGMIRDDALAGGEGIEPGTVNTSAALAMERLAELRRPAA